MIRLEQPRLQNQGDPAERVAALERYLFRLIGQLQLALESLERQQKQ